MWKQYLKSLKDTSDDQKKINEYFRDMNLNFSEPSSSIIDINNKEIMTYDNNLTITTNAIYINYNNNIYHFFKSPISNNGYITISPSNTKLMLTLLPQVSIYLFIYLSILKFSLLPIYIAYL
jgi:hypothetical protein